MDVKATVLSQYQASLGMLEQAVSLCPPALWLDAAPKNAFWHLAYHALFYTHLYLHDSEEAFLPWEEHQKESQFLGPLPWPPHAKPADCRPYRVEEVRAFLEICRSTVARQVPKLDLEAPSGFPWLPFDRLELQFYNIRHLQHHTGQLAYRLRISGDLPVAWIGSASR